MEDILATAASYVSWGVEFIAIAVIAIGSIDALIGIVRAGMGSNSTASQRAIWMRFARWLVAAMTFQLAADVVGTSVAPTWDEVGRLAAIAAIRTFLSFFLDREMEEKSGRLEEVYRARKT